jgi:hypothetical protein
LPEPPAKEPDRPAADALARALRQRRQSVLNLKMLVLALYNYEDTFRRLPGNITDKQGHPLLSWRVAVLPFLEGGGLYKEFKLDEPWDSPHNKKLLAKMPRVFRAPTQPEGATDTFYQGFSGPRALFGPSADPLSTGNIPDGSINTLAVIEAGKPVPWTKPQDLPYDAGKPLPALGGVLPHVINAAFLDGTVLTLRKDFDEKTLRAAITRDGGEQFDRNDLREPPLRLRAREAEAAGRKGPEAGSARDEADLLRSENDRLQEAIQAAATEAARAQAELARLREQASRRKEAEAEAARQAERNETLTLELANTRFTLDRLREEIARLQKAEKK